MMALLKTVAAITPAAAAVLIGQSAQAQDTRGRLNKIVVPFPPGGTADVIARLIAQHAETSSGQRFIIENRPGAGTIIGTDAVARSAPDASTMLVMSNSFVINGVVRSSLPYDPMTSFEPVCMVADSPQVLVVHDSTPYRSLQDFVQAAKAKPGELSYATVGPATTQHIAGESLKRALQVNLTYVPYTGGAPAVNAILGGHVTTVIANYNEVMEQLGPGKLRPLAVFSSKRIKQLPDVPTLDELGHKDQETSAFFGIVVPAKSPKDAVGQLTTILKAATSAPEVVSKFETQGLLPGGPCGEEFRAHIQRQHDKYVRAIKEAGIKAE